jgi:ribonuclease R
MEFSVARLFAQFQPQSDDATPPSSLTRSALEAALDISRPSQQEQLTVALDALVRIGYLAVESHDTGEAVYRLSENDKLVEGQLRCSSKGFCFAIRNEPGVEDVYIHGTNLNGAWNGDRVLARVVKDGNRRRSPEGHVAAVIERANPTVVAQLKRDETGFKAVPLDDRLLFELDLAFTQSDETADELAESLIPPEAAEDKFVYVEVERYPLAQLPPRGYVHKILGSSQHVSMDIDLVCCKHELQLSFPDAVEAAADKVHSKLTKTDLKKRQDYRDWFTVGFAVGESPHQLALTLMQKQGQLWQLGVHIVDVAHALLVDHPVDAEARQRGISAHLDGVVLPLFPEQVRQQCGFAAGDERTAISVLLLLAADGSVQSYKIHPSVVSCNRLVGDSQAEAFLSGSESAEPDLVAFLEELIDLGPQLRQHRHQAGGCDFNLPQSDAHFIDEGNGGVPVIDPARTVRAAIAEIQILANHAIAKHFHELGVPALFRVQPIPTPEMLQSFLRLLDNMALGVELANPDSVSPKDLQGITQRIGAEEGAASASGPHLARQLADVLPEASEQLEVAPHCGVGYTPYCHATAPLQRYVDLLHQRLLHAIFSKGRDRRSSRVKTGVDLTSSSCHGQVNWGVLPPKLEKEWQELLEASVEHINTRQNLVRAAEEELAGLKRSEYMQQHVGQTVNGTIVGVQNYGFFVLTDPVLAEGLVHVSSLKNDWYEYRNRQQALVGRKSRQQFRLGDRIEVEVKSVDYYRQQIDLAAVGGGKVYEDEEE